MTLQPLPRDSTRLVLPPGVELAADLAPGFRSLLTPGALSFVVDLERRFRTQRSSLLARRMRRQSWFDAGHLPDFLPETADVRGADWKVAPVPDDLIDRRVEITGPVDRKMIINALSSGANVFVADFEDSCAPTWENLVGGQMHLRDAVRGKITYLDVATGKRYQLGERTATLMVRPRGWHLHEKHVVVDGWPMSASLFDFGLYLFHNAGELLNRGTGPYFYLPKLESHHEARLWNEVFVAAQRALELSIGTIKATVLIETLPAAFEMDEILFELRDHVVGLNCGRWDYIFSFIKTFRSRPGFVLPDRATVGMDCHFLRSYSRLLIQTCHRRGAHAMGGMAAQIPIKDDVLRNAEAMGRVRDDKRREVTNGHDGTWVAHPGLVEVARREFDARMRGPNQVDVQRVQLGITPLDLLAVPGGQVTVRGLRQNLSVGVRYLASWLCGNGCVPIDDLMEDAATAEISRAQVWQWIRHGARLDDGRRVALALVRRALSEELGRMQAEIGEVAYQGRRYPLAAELLWQMITAERLPDFLTPAAYAHL